MNGVGESAPLVRCPEVNLERVGADAILHDRQRGRVHVVNQSAAAIWELCDGTRTAGDVASAFAASFGLPATEVTADVEALTRQFRSLGLLA